MENKHFTAREKLELMKQMEARNEERRKAFAEKKARDERLLDMYLEGYITKEELYKRMEKRNK